MRTHAEREKKCEEITEALIIAFNDKVQELFMNEGLGMQGAVYSKVILYLMVTVIDILKESGRAKNIDGHLKAMCEHSKELAKEVTSEHVSTRAN